MYYLNNNVKYAISLKGVSPNFFETAYVDYYWPGSILDSSHDYPIL